MAFVDALISLRPEFGFNILVAALFGLVAILLVWQGSWALIVLAARPYTFVARALRVCCAILIFAAGCLGALLVAGVTTGILYLVIFAAALLGMVLQAKREPRLPIAELDPSNMEEQILPGAGLGEAEIFAAAVELQLDAIDIEVGLFRNGISPLEKRSTLGKKTIRMLR